MDNFYKQFFGKDEYPPDKKAPLDDSYEDDLESTVDDRSSHIGNEKYNDLHSLNLGPPSQQPLDGEKKGKLDDEAKSPPMPKSGKGGEKPRETYLRMDDEDETIMPKRAAYDEGVWPPREEDMIVPIMNDFGKPEPNEKGAEKKKQPRITYYESDRPPAGPKSPQRRPPPQQRPDMPHPVRRNDMPPPVRRHDMPPSPPPQKRHDMPPPVRRHDTPPPGRGRRPPPPQQRRPNMPPPGRDGRPNMPPPHRRPNMPPPNGRRPPPPMSEKMPPGYPGNRRQRLQQQIMPYLGKWGKVSRSWA
ncbi:hypothetical protein IWW50_005475, partial [Coemansia erecta]